MGDGTDYTPYTVNFTAGTFASAYVRARLTSSVHPSIGAPTDYINRYWTTACTGVTGPVYTATYVYGPDGTDVVGTEASLGGALYIGSWVSYPSTTVTPGTNTVSLTGMAFFGDFTAATASAPLPIELLFFDAKLDGRSVNVDWTTGAEKNNDYFTVERSIDGASFEEIAIVKGAGNSNTVINYSAIDENPLNGTSYYRLKQTDFDGKFSCSNLVAVKTSLETLFSVYPNPSDGSNVTISLNGSSAKEILVVVLDMTGRESYSKIVPTFRDGTFLIATDPSSKLAPGVYLVTATSDNKIYNQKLIIR